MTQKKATRKLPSLPSITAPKVVDARSQEQRDADFNARGKRESRKVDFKVTVTVAKYRNRGRVTIAVAPRDVAKMRGVFGLRPGAKLRLQALASSKGILHLSAHEGGYALSDSCLALTSLDRINIAEPLVDIAKHETTMEWGADGYVIQMAGFAVYQDRGGDGMRKRDSNGRPAGASNKAKSERRPIADAPANPKSDEPASPQGQLKLEPAKPDVGRGLVNPCVEIPDLGEKPFSVLGLFPFTKDPSCVHRHNVNSPPLANALWMRLVRTKSPRIESVDGIYVLGFTALDPQTVVLRGFDMADSYYGGIGDLVLELRMDDLTSRELEMLAMEMGTIMDARAENEYQRRNAERRANEVRAIREEMYGI
jgi:hypothetical protein